MNAATQQTQTAPRERPILFSAPLVRAILAGTKTQTRRPVKPQPNVSEAHAKILPAAWASGFIDVRCPFGVPGDRLWVRETWAAVHFSPAYSEGFATGYSDDWYGSEQIPKDSKGGWWTPCYAAEPHHESHRDDRGFDWRPSIHMPRWASRLTLEITDVRVERVRDISEADARAEGFEPITFSTDGRGTDVSATSRERFESTWSAIYGAESWARNDWVWVVSFRRLP